jgi:integrase
MGLHTADGARKYLTAGERDAFLREAELADRQVRTLCMTLAFTGCRLSEALALTADRVDLAAGVLVFESLKKRRPGVFPRLFNAAVLGGVSPGGNRQEEK